MNDCNKNGMLFKTRQECKDCYDEHFSSLFAARKSRRTTDPKNVQATSPSSQHDCDRNIYIYIYIYTHTHTKEEALDRTMWRARFGRGFGPVVRQTAK